MHSNIYSSATSILGQTSENTALFPAFSSSQVTQVFHSLLLNFQLYKSIVRKIFLDFHCLKCTKYCVSRAKVQFLFPLLLQLSHS